MSCQYIYFVQGRCACEELIDGCKQCSSDLSVEMSLPALLSRKEIHNSEVIRVREVDGIPRCCILLVLDEGKGVLWRNKWLVHRTIHFDNPLITHDKEVSHNLLLLWLCSEQNPKAHGEP